jgi:hypothetical protein
MTIDANEGNPNRIEYQKKNAIVRAPRGLSVSCAVHVQRDQGLESSSTDGATDTASARHAIIVALLEQL